jgi:uncharacterized membrane protein
MAKKKMPRKTDEKSGKKKPAIPAAKLIDRDLNPIEFGRIVALSDGVFAIALTLLVLDLALPIGAAGGNLFQELMARQAHFWAFAISLLFVGSAWWSHHHLFSMLQGVNGLLTAMNIFYLGLVALLPFVQGVLAAYPDEPLSYAVFAAVLAAIGAIDLVIFMYARSRSLLRSYVNDRMSRIEILASAAFSLTFLFSIPLAYLIGPYVVLIWVFWPFVGLWIWEKL